MRILIDLQGAQTESRYRGIGRYTLSLTKAIVRNCGDHQVIIILSGLYPLTIDFIRAEFNELLSQENIRVWEAAGPVGEIGPENAWRRETAELIREAYIASLSPDFVLMTTLFEGLGGNFVGSIGKLGIDVPTAVILYDLIPLANPKTYLTDSTTRFWFQNKVMHCKRADLLLSISESSRKEAIQYLDFCEEKIENISAATDGKFYPMELSILKATELREKFSITKDFLMYSGASDDRKNHLRLISAYSQLPDSVRSKHQLFIVGEIPSSHRVRFLEYAFECGLGSAELIVSGRVNDEELIALYNLCKAFVMPSWHEGFGLPALEAMSCGKAVIASSTTSLPEVIGRSDALFDPFDEQSMLVKIKRVLTDESFRVDLEQHGLNQSKKFTWNSASRKALEAMEKADENHLSNSHHELTSTNKDQLQPLLINSIAQLSHSHSESDLLRTAVAIAQNHSIQGRRQMLVDVSELVVHDAKTGVQRVTKGILSELLANPPEGLAIEPVYTKNKEGYYYARKFTRQFLNLPPNDINDDVIVFKSNDIFFGLDLLHPSKAIDNKIFYQQMRNHGVLVYFFVYDLLPIQFPEYANVGVTAGHKKWLEVIIESDGAICISRTTSNELSLWMDNRSVVRHRPFSNTYCHLGADINYSASTRGIPDSALELQEIIQKNTSFLMVGTIEPRKGHAQVIAAFEQLWKEGIRVNLVIVGKQGWLVDDLVKSLYQHQELGTRLFWLQGISDEYLELVYASCNCLLVPSEGEGFGLPLIEAAQHKLPIIARNIPIFREVAGEHAFYFEGLMPGDIVMAIRDWLKLHESDTHPSSDSMPWLTWHQSTAKLLEILGVASQEVEDSTSN